MRLTLRTLLAYLDDTLEPAEIKTIGQKVAESDAAQELIARIKQVTRRRRLTTPPTSGPGGFDPNSIAEYLDNELSSEQIAEVEKLCLESDVHLAEIAACHQILTLVLGEPALVPPTAKERMYGLVKGREAIPFRKAPAQPAAAAGPFDDGEDALMPFGQLRTSWTLWGGALVGLCLFVVLGFALWSTIAVPQDRQVAGKDKLFLDKDDTKDAKTENKSEKAAIAEEKGTGKESKSGDGKEVKGETKESKPGPGTESKPAERKEERPAEGKEGKPADGKPTTPVDAKPGAVVERALPPSLERRELASYSVDANKLPSVLLTRPGDSLSWRRVEGGRRLTSAEPLVSLPGCPSELRVDSGVRLQLWGTLPEFTGRDFLLESAVTLHANQRFDLDFTLDRGRVFLINHKDRGPALARVRFDKEVWDLTLQEPGTEVAIDFFKKNTPDIDFQGGEEPRAELYLYVVQGKASLKTDPYQEYPDLSGPPGRALFSWDNKGSGARGPVRLDMPLAFFGKELPVNDQVNRMRQAIEGLGKRMVDKKAVNVVLQEGLLGDQPEQHILSILSLAAIDDVPALLDILADETPTHGQDRLAALHALRRWISRSADHSRRLFDPRTGTGVLIDKKYTRGEAQIILELLHEFGPEKWRQVETFETLIRYLRLEKIALRELAYWHLAALSQGVRTPQYNPAMLPEQRDAAVRDFQQLVKDGKLPPGQGAAPAKKETGKGAPGGR